MISLSESISFLLSWVFLVEFSKKRTINNYRCHLYNSVSLIQVYLAYPRYLGAVILIRYFCFVLNDYFAYKVRTQNEKKQYYFFFHNIFYNIIKFTFFSFFFCRKEKKISKFLTLFVPNKNLWIHPLFVFCPTPFPPYCLISSN